MRTRQVRENLSHNTGSTTETIETCADVHPNKERNYETKPPERCSRLWMYLPRALDSTESAPKVLLQAGNASQSASIHPRAERVERAWWFVSFYQGSLLHHQQRESLVKTSDVIVTHLHRLFVNLYSRAPSTAHTTLPVGRVPACERRPAADTANLLIYDLVV